MPVETRDEAVRIISAELETSSSPEICILYGSAARDRLTPSSDIDIAVASESGLSNDFCLELSIRLGLRIGREVSVLNLSKLEGLILREILTEGIQIRNDNPGYLSQFIIKMYDYAEDIFPLQMEGIKKTLKKSLRA